MNYGKSNKNNKKINEKDALQVGPNNWNEEDMRGKRNSQSITNLVPRVPMKIVLLIAPLVTRSFSKSFWVEIQEEGFSIKCNWVV